ncbi:threonine aldolase family protein [Heyndrickxia camelliae]|uniref:Low specificity L-threonine aldolase n=1 Tax=Heyndrickxia camelliae TaxID=1707093 RepID=A0A2N3LIQ5_9BACI|nr:aminotransferase class I/II-fold pyridoxal phosphate-dependent enzyme [Heyndrickxia camelliae]PKR84413.1 low specificity L-threonine aldolase [Heyndrickxia camelliae]
MINFQSDYLEGCHPKILDKLIDTNFQQTSGYGNDEYSKSAIQKIKKACKREDIDVHFLVGGTQTNSIVIAAILRPHQGVVSAISGHIATHEAGAIEATGHQVLTLPSEDGKIQAKQVKELYDEHWNNPMHESVVQPGMVYISNPTENGTLYSKAELESLSEVCRRLGLPLFLDGARLGYALTSPNNDLTLEDIASLCDVFYIGGTKCGALFGEAVVICSDSLKRDFRYIMKQRGGILAKGRLLGVQFDVLFEENLYYEICGSAVDYALKIKQAFEEKGIKLFGESFTNQQFPILTNRQLDYLGKKYGFEIWSKISENETIVRFCTSWATKKENVDALIDDIELM